MSSVDVYLYLYSLLILYLEDDTAFCVGALAMQFTFHLL